MAAIGTRLFTWFSGSCVGRDEFGNRYYQQRSKPRHGRRKRWVLYNGIVEASKVPPSWHGWLHYTVEKPMSFEEANKHEWQKPHMPNLTGTKHAYLPSGHVLKGAERDSTVSDYEAWHP